MAALAQHEGPDSWVLDVLHSLFSSPAWETPLMSFIDDNCVVFDARQDEGELHHTELHMQFTELVEKLLETQLAELGISPEDFAAIVLRSGQESPLFRLLSTHLLALDDFETFRRLMVKRNLELELLAIQAVRGTAVRASSFGPSSPGGAKLSSRGPAPEETEEEALKRAIAMSEAEAESARQLAEMEAAVLEAAVAESLALEAQQQQLLEREAAAARERLASAPAPSSSAAAAAAAAAAAPAAAAASAAEGAAADESAASSVRAQFDDLRISHSRGADASSRPSQAREGKEDAEVAHSGAQSIARAPAAPAAESAPRVGSARAPLEVGGGGGSARGGASSSDGRSAGSFLRDIPPLGSSAAPSSSRAPHLGAATGARGAGDGVAFALPEDSRDWPGVSAVRALAEASLADVDAEAVRRAKRELVKRKNAERARALAEMRQDAEGAPPARLPSATAFQHAVAHARAGGSGASLAMDLIEPEARGAPPPAPLSMDERRRAMRMRLMQQLGEEARAEAVGHEPAEGKGTD